MAVHPMHPRLGATPLPLPTERDELAEERHLSAAFAALPPTTMLAIEETAQHRSSPSHWPCASSTALDHPGLTGTVRRARSLGYHVAVDTSLRDWPRADMPRAASSLLAHLHTVGAYFSPPRQCVGLAVDSMWHEAIHEMVHLQFDAHGLNPEARGRGGGGSSGSSSGGGGNSSSHPLRDHWLGFRARGYSERTAEELVAREHEVRALTTSGAPFWRWAIRALCVVDSALIEAQRDLATTPAAARTPAQAAEWRRVGWARSCVSGPAPRLAFAAIPVMGAATLAGAIWRRVHQHRAAALPSAAGAASHPEREPDVR